MIKLFIQIKTRLIDGWRHFAKDLASDWRVPCLILLPFALALLAVDLKYTKLGFLQLHSIDEYTLYGSLRYMFQGFGSGRLSSLFGYGFYQYGFIYFFLNWFLAFPFLWADFAPGAIIIPRLVSSGFALFGIFYIYRTARLQLAKAAPLLLAIFALAMPGFWYNATWFHPDWAMTAFLLGTVYYLKKDNWNFGTDFWLGVIFFGIAVAFKYQALTALPLILGYVFYDFLLRGERLDWRQAKLAIGAIGLTFGIFLLGNPYIAHPLGFRAFESALIGNLKSNATNHGAGAIPTVADKIGKAIDTYYLNYFLFFFLTGFAIWLLIIALGERRSRNFYTLLAGNYLIGLGYLLFGVNKAWQMYYLPVIMPAVLLLVPALHSLSIKKQISLLVILLAVMLGSYGTRYVPMLTASRDGTGGDTNKFTTAENAELDRFARTFLTGRLKTNDKILLSPYTPLDYPELGLSYEDVKIIYGPVAERHIDLAAYVSDQREVWGNLKSDEEFKKHFVPVNWMVLRKDSPFIDLGKFANPKPRTPWSKYSKVAENNFIIIYRHK
jgi:hypothetical protein